MVVRPASAETAARALREAALTGLAGALDGDLAGILLTLRTVEEEPDALRRLAVRIRALADGDVVVAAGEGVATPKEARRSLLEASQVAMSVRHIASSPGEVLRLADVGLPGLLHMLRDEPRLQTFVEQELGPLLAHDARHPREQLLGVLRVYLERGRNKSAAAEHSHLSRPAFYERLARIRRVLGVDLDSVRVCLSLHVALLALDALRD